MNSDINLVSSKTQQLEREIKRLKMLKIIAIFSLAIVALISILLFFITITLPVSSVKKDQEQALSGISSLHEKFVKYSLINDRLSNIASLIKSRKNYDLLVNTVLNKLPADLTVDSMTIEGKTFTLVISGASLTPIDKFIEDITLLADEEKIIQNLVIEGLLVHAESGKYTLTLEADTLL